MGIAHGKFFLAHFVAHCESCAQDVETVILRLEFVVVVFLERVKNTIAVLCFSDNSEIFATP